MVIKTIINYRSKDIVLILRSRFPRSITYGEKHAWIVWRSFTQDLFPDDSDPDLGIPKWALEG